MSLTQYIKEATKIPNEIDLGISLKKNNITPMMIPKLSVGTGLFLSNNLKDNMRWSAQHGELDDKGDSFIIKIKTKGKTNIRVNADSHGGIDGYINKLKQAFITTLKKQLK